MVPKVLMQGHGRSMPGGDAATRRLRLLKRIGLMRGRANYGTLWNTWNSLTFGGLEIYGQRCFFSYSQCNIEVRLFVWSLLR